ncbi:unnamed protein product, partial [Rotaria sordida]
MVSNFTALVEDVITCPFCQKHFDQPHCPDSNAPPCYRCETKKAEHWCDGDCKHCFCSQCWNIVHELGQYKTHTKRFVKDRPFDIPKCQEPDHCDDGTYRCEQCNRNICNSCQQLKHKDHRVELVIGE